MVKPNQMTIIAGYPGPVSFECQSDNKVEWFRLDADKFLFESKTIEIKTATIKQHRTYYCKTKTDDGFTVFGYAKIKAYSK